MSVISEYCSIWTDPIRFAKVFWPDVYFYDLQREMIYSCEFNIETYLKSCNQAGKDYTAGFIILKQFMCHPVARIIPTSIKDDHLRVLEGELTRWINTSKFPLRVEDGGILKVNHRDIRKLQPGGKMCEISYIRLMVSEKGEGMAGHHAPYTMVVGDEASGLDNQVKDQSQGWAKRALWFGNPNQCENFYRKGCDEGDVLSDDGEHYLRKVITIKATDIPTIRRGIALEKLGLPTDDEPIVPGVLTYSQYKFRRRMWDPIRQCVGLDAEFYVGKELLLYPPEWLSKSNEMYLSIPKANRVAKAIGVDAAEGGDDTAICAVDELGVIEIESIKTPDTSVIMGRVLALARRVNCSSSAICFDRGGGGKQIADRMREAGYPVTTVAFNEAVNLEIKRVRHQTEVRRENREDKSAYTNRRQEMYGTLSDAIDVSRLYDEAGNEIKGARIFGIPPASKGEVYAGLLHEMKFIPKKYDQEGQLKVPPKRKKDKAGPNAEKCLEEIVGHSPDKLDALAIAYWRMTNKSPVKQAGAVL